jgi:hypothetical protein
MARLTLALGNRSEDNMKKDDEFKRLDALIAQRLYWQLPIIAQRAREVADRIKRDAQTDPADMRRPTTI